MTIDKEKQTRISALLKLGDASWRSFDTRRAYEWKVNLALWPALALFAALQLRGEIKGPGSLGGMFAIGTVLFAIFSVYAFVWTKELFKRNRVDTIAAHDYWGLVEAELGLGENAPSVKRKKEAKEEEWWNNWSHQAQVAMTALFVILATGAMFISHSYPAQEASKGEDAKTINVQANCCCDKTSVSNGLDCCTARKQDAMKQAPRPQR